MNEERPLEVLLVDDDPGHVELVRRNFRRVGLLNRVTTLGTGEEALDFLFRRGSWTDRSTDAPLLVILDVKMPGGADGIEVLRQVKAEPATSAIPIAMLTTTDDPRDVARCYALGCSVYLTKPVDPGRFIESIRRLGLFLEIVKVPPERSNP